MKRFSLLDLSPIPEGQTAGDALANTVSLAIAAETFGYHRYWLAEHHNMPGLQVQLFYRAKLPLQLIRCVLVLAA